MKDIIKSKIDINDYPNALAHIKVHPQEKMIEVVETVKKFDDLECQSTNMKRPRKTNKTSTRKYKNSNRILSTRKSFI